MSGHVLIRICMLQFAGLMPLVDASCLTNLFSNKAHLALKL